MGEVEAATETVEQLEKQHATLKAQMSDLLARALTGTDTSGELSTLTREAADVSRRLESARDAELEQKEKAQTALRSKQRETFDRAIEEGATARAQFTALFRQTCLALGDYCVALQTATGLRAAVSLPLGPYSTLTLMPDDANRLQALITFGDPLADLLEGDGDLQGCMNFGHDLTVRCVPLVNRLEQHLKKENS